MPTPQTIASLLYRALMFAGDLVCHQRPERSPHLWGVQMPLCWRCSGIVVGAAALVIWLAARRRVPALVPSLLLALLMPLDVLAALLFEGPGENARRFVTGALWGAFGTSAALHLVRRAAVMISLASVEDACRRGVEAFKIFGRVRSRPGTEIK